MANYRISFKDWVLKSWLGIKNWVRYVAKITKPGKFEVPKEYELVFHDNFKKDYKISWRDASQWWGLQYHPSFLTHWFDVEQISQSRVGIEFNAAWKPKYFPEIDTTIGPATGSINSRQAWQYGIFIYTAKMPVGTHVCPALWASGSINWPPEIDVLEAYTDETLDYKKGVGMMSNVHMTFEGQKADAKQLRHRLPNKIASEFIDYVLWWEKDFIKIYYNGYLVRHITDPRVLELMSEPMILVIGTGVKKEFNKTATTPMIVDKVVVYQKK